MLDWLVHLPCWFLHRMWRIPIWNRSTFLACPIAWLAYRSPRFDAWYWRHEKDV